MEITIIAIIALVGAWLLIKNYDKIDTALFGQNNPDYEPSGRPVVGISLLLGAVFGGLFLYTQLSDSASQQQTAVYTYTGVSLLVIWVAIAMFTTLCSALPIGLAIGKCVFMTFCTAVAFGLGFAGALIVFAVFVIWLILQVFSAAITDRKVNVKSEGMFGLFATKSTLTHIQGDEYKDRNGTRYVREGNEFYKRE